MACLNMHWSTSFLPDILCLKNQFNCILELKMIIFIFSVQFKLGSVELQAVPDSTEVINELINFVFHRNAELRGNNDHLQQENTRLLSERNYSLEE